MTLGQNGILKYGHFCVNINVNNGQNKFEVHISISMAKKANFQPKIGLDATFAPTLSGHNSAIFYPILTSDHIKMVSSPRRIEWYKQLSSFAFFLVFGFLLQSLAWAVLRASCWYMSRPSPPAHRSKSCFQN